MWQPSNCNLDVSMGTWENISIALIYFLKTLILIQLVAFSFFGSHIYIYISIYIYHPKHFERSCDLQHMSSVYIYIYVDCVSFIWGEG